MELLLAHLASPAGPPAFSTLYLNDVDNAGHATGPDSAEVEQAVSAVDVALWRLLQGLNASRLLSSTHIALVSDHGMAPLSACRVIPMATLLPSSNLTALLAAGAALNGPYVGIPCDGCSAAEARALAVSMNQAAAAAGLDSRITLYYKEDLQARLGGFGASPRVWPVVGTVALGWSATSSSLPSYQACGGTHGWDPRYGAMGALGVFVGPRFGAGGRAMASPAQLLLNGSAGAVPNTEVYALLGMFT